MDQPLWTTVSQVPEQPLLKWDYQFDPEGNLFNVKETVGGTSAPASIPLLHEDYDARNRLNSAEDAFGRHVNFTYDKADNVATFADASPAAADNRVSLRRRQPPFHGYAARAYRTARIYLAGRQPARGSAVSGRHVPPLLLRRRRQDDRASRTR